VERALALDPELADAYAAMALISNDHDWNWPAANDACQRALALEPANTSVLLAAEKVFFTQGRFEEAYTMCRRAIDLDPLNALAYSRLGYTAYYTGQLVEAAAVYKRVIELDPEFRAAHSSLGLVRMAQLRLYEALGEMQQEKSELLRSYGLALVYFSLGNKPESDKALSHLVAEGGPGDWAFQISEVFAFRGEVDKAFEWLERAYERKDSGLTDIKGDPLLRNLEIDLRYSVFLKKMRLPA
jgi:tetratricopeptide (TPR) repeat protein